LLQRLQTGITALFGTGAILGILTRQRGELGRCGLGLFAQLQRLLARGLKALRIGDAEKDLADPVPRRRHPAGLARVIGLLQFDCTGVIGRHLTDRLQVVAKDDLLGGRAGLLLDLRTLTPALGNQNSIARQACRT
jgi:hypothetical protein